MRKKIMTPDERETKLREKHGKDAIIVRAPLPEDGGVCLENLKDNQVVYYGDGKTFYFLVETK